MTDAAWVGRYVGIPFSEAGFDFAGCNCWGLVHLVLKCEAGILVPTYAEATSEDIAKANDLFATESIRGPWVRADAPLRKFDVALLRGHPTHAGILIDDKTILHVWKATQAVQMPLEHPCLRFRLVGFFRHKDLV